MKDELEGRELRKGKSKKIKNRCVTTELREEQSDELMTTKFEPQINLEQ